VRGLMKVAALMVAACLLTSSAEAKTKMYSFSSLANGASWTTTAVNWADTEATSFVIGFRNGMGTGGITLKLQGSMDATNWVDLTLPEAVPTPTASVYQIVPRVMAATAIGDNTRWAPVTPAPHLRLVVTNNTGAAITALKAAFIHYQSR